MFDAEAWSIADALFAEGLAVVASLAAVPGATPSSALWTGLAALPDGSPVGGWPAACEAAWPSLRSALVRATESTDRAVYRTSFLGRRDDETFPLRAGYYAGWRLAAALHRDVPIAKLAHWPLATVRSEVARLLVPRGVRPGHAGA